MYFIIVKDVISHSLRVMNYTNKLCKEFKISKKEKTNLIIAALLHDIGKFMIPKKTLFKKSQLSIDEKKIINKHSEYSYEILKWALSKEILYLIKNHHNLEEINKNNLIRILHIADVYDALTSERIYKKAMSKEDAVKEIKRNLKNKNLDLNVLYQKTA